MPRLTVQRDDVGRVVRLVGEDTAIELSPDRATELGEAIIRAGRELATEQSTLAEPPADQATLDDPTPQRESLSEMYDRLGGADRRSPEPGEVINENDPLKW